MMMNKLMILAIIATLMHGTSVAMAGPGCSGGRKASSGASCSYSGASCSYSAAQAAALEAFEIDTTRLPSGAMLVFYTSDDPTAVKRLQAKAETGVGDFDCRLCRKIAGDRECTIEMAFIEKGVVALVTADDVATVDAYEKQYAALTSPDATYEP